MNEIQIFNNPQFGEIRTAGTADNPLFCLADVCKALDLGNPSQVKARLADGVISNEGISDSLGRTQYVNFVNEDGLYDVILDSRKPEAKAFRKWITSEVLPSIRKTGGYTNPAYQLPQSYADALRELAGKVEENERLMLENQKQASMIEEQAPKVVFADAIVGSRSSCLIGELAKILRQNGIEIGQNRLFQWMREQHYLGTRGEYYNVPLQQWVEQGLFELKQNVYSVNGEIRTKTTTKVTGKGQQYFINIFLKENKNGNK